MLEKGNQDSVHQNLMYMTFQEQIYQRKSWVSIFLKRRKMSGDEERSRYHILVVRSVRLIFTTGAQKGWCCLWRNPASPGNFGTYAANLPLETNQRPRGFGTAGNSGWKACPTPPGPPQPICGHHLRQALRDQTGMGCYLRKHAGIYKSFI